MKLSSLHQVPQVINGIARLHTPASDAPGLVGKADMELGTEVRWCQGGAQQGPGGVIPEAPWRRGGVLRPGGEGLVGGERRKPLIQDHSSWQDCGTWRDGRGEMEGNGQTPDFRRAYLQVTLGFEINPKNRRSLGV